MNTYHVHKLVQIRMTNMKTIILSVLFVLTLAIYGQANAVTNINDFRGCDLIKTKTSCFVTCRGYGNGTGVAIIKTNNEDCQE